MMMTASCRDDSRIRPGVNQEDIDRWQSMAGEDCWLCGGQGSVLAVHGSPDDSPLSAPGVIVPCPICVRPRIDEGAAHVHG